MDIKYRKLEIRDVPKILALQESVYNSLPKNNKNFIVKKMKNFLQIFF